MLDQYLRETTRLLRDFNQQDINPRDMVSYINAARREVAARSQCIRRLTPISGQVQSITVTDGGSGYSENPTVAISGPDFPSGLAPYPTGSQATAIATVIDGVIQSIDVTYGGSGYFNPTVTITDDTGSGATATASVPGLNILNTGQEFYNFSDINLDTFPGVESVIAIKSVSVIYSNWRYGLTYRSFTSYQSLRAYPILYQFVPTVYTQYGQGTEGSLAFYPLPSMPLQAEYDCLCLPTDLVDNQSVEAIPNMWRDGVKWFAASLAFNGCLNWNAGAAMEAQFDKFCKRFAEYAQPGRATAPYSRFRAGRW